MPCGKFFGRDLKIYFLMDSSYLEGDIVGDMVDQSLTSSWHLARLRWMAMQTCCVNFLFSLLWLKNSVWKIISLNILKIISNKDICSFGDSTYAILYIWYHISNNYLRDISRVKISTQVGPWY